MRFQRTNGGKVLRSGIRRRRKRLGLSSDPAQIAFCCPNLPPRVRLFEACPLRKLSGQEGSLVPAAFFSQRIAAGGKPTFLTASYEACGIYPNHSANSNHGRTPPVGDRLFAEMANEPATVSTDAFVDNVI